MQLKTIPQHSIVTLVAGLLSVLAYAYLGINSQSYGDANLIQVLSVCSVSAFLCAWVWVYHYRRNVEVSIGLILAFAIAFRVIGIFSFPLLEDDAYRYLWDGKQTIENGNPYLYPPSHFFDSENISDAFEEILNAINYPYVATVYGPTNQWVFALAYLISPGEVWPLQLIFALADMAIIFALLKLSRPAFVLLYAWSPLVIKEFAFTAHPDVLGAMLMVFALLAYRKENPILIGFLMACAMGVKIFPVLILPFLLGFKWRGWLAFVITVAAISYPFGIVQAWLPEGLRVMSGDWFFNSPLYLAYIKLTPVGYSAQTIKFILLAMLTLGMGLYLLKTLQRYWQDKWPQEILKGDLVFGAFFLCLPALNPWYFVWLLPFAVIRPSVTAWVTSVAILMSYICGINLNNTELGPYQHPNWVLVVEFGIILIAFIVDVFLRKTSTQTT